MILLSYLILYCAFEFVFSQRPNIVVIVADDLVSIKGHFGINCPLGHPIKKGLLINSDKFIYFILLMKFVCFAAILG